ncbi:unnamed protein product (macronuclear) [Paramecium tetraurelia]|uniref:non-specific serine/threonine protein kinase n=1 Tax=Paramecium tetraurelia TaxID=5888 RepID=A0CF05_PARTE|nr:uncharacterized protein GSPATT00037811001 [Paramecium tetraurelia]CAK69372.1 unnamed protein product [Paramecium tetraurelia]|eukprot:XP_001436769.1 hypothetical protein (macronuclear) [Paramecium tetraurelia strain d4-2]
MDVKIKDSFFDDPETTTFWVNNGLPNQDQILQMQDSMYIQKENEFCKRTLGIQNHYLLYFKKQTAQKWVNLDNATIEYVKHQSVGLGIRISKHKQCFEFFGDVEPWYNYLRQYCVQRNFSQSYTLLKKIGQGNFADVYKATNKMDGAEYAIKCFRKNKLKENVDRLSMIKEISIMKKIQHESVIKLYEVYEGDDCLYLVLEYLRGGELHQFMKKSPPFSEEKCSKLIFRILKALYSIHQKGILHRDLKPENIMLRNKDDLDNICIGDFGLADYYSPSGQYLFTRCGTPGYVAPELLQDKLYDFKIDIYSVGILMYILIAGKSPFDGKDYDDVVMRNYYAKVKFEDCKLTEVGMNFLKGLMNKNPIQRFSAEEALNHPWFATENSNKACQFKIRKQNYVLKKLGHCELQIKQFSAISTQFSPKSSLSSLSPYCMTKYNLDESPQTPNSPSAQFAISTPRTPGMCKLRPVRRSQFNLKQI